MFNIWYWINRSTVYLSLAVKNNALYGVALVSLLGIMLDLGVGKIEILYTGETFDHGGDLVLMAIVFMYSFLVVRKCAQLNAEKYQ